MDESVGDSQGISSSVSALGRIWLKKLFCQRWTRPFSLQTFARPGDDPGEDVTDNPGESGLKKTKFWLHQKRTPSQRLQWEEEKEVLCIEVILKPLVSCLSASSCTYPDLDQLYKSCKHTPWYILDVHKQLVVLEYGGNNGFRILCSKALHNLKNKRPGSFIFSVFLYYISFIWLHKSTACPGDSKH